MPELFRRGEVLPEGRTKEGERRLIGTSTLSCRWSWNGFLGPVLSFRSPLNYFVSRLQETMDHSLMRNRSVISAVDNRVTEPVSSKRLPVANSASACHCAGDFQFRCSD